jgi:hypothetical protein
VLFAGGGLMSPGLRVVAGILGTWVRQKDLKSSHHET